MFQPKMKKLLYLDALEVTSIERLILDESSE